ncbi:hypothetical protein [uncultured Jatrophihabitans sp.]|uniref:hypothetical protein n=1 Tax=uncultured Jatrophihabitans sp. TaxID=1610747 RepID=UPI0035CAECF9
MQASDGDRRFTAALGALRRVLTAGPRWESSRVLTGGAAAAVAVLAVTGVVALSTSGSAATRTKDVAATATPAKPHYLLPIGSLVKDGSVPAPTLSGDNGTVGVPKGTAARPTKPTTNPNLADITTYRGGSGTMTAVGIATLALERGCSTAQAPTATAIAMAESGGSPSAQGDVSLMTDVWDWSAGLWQIRGLRAQRGTGALRDSIANQQAVTNSVAMYAISNGCTNWSPWTTYTRGLYVGYLGIAGQAVNYVVAYYKAHGQYPPVAAPDPNAAIPVSTGGGGAAVPATVASGSSSRTARPTKARTSTAPNAPAKTTPTKAAGQPSAASSTSTSARTTTPASVPTKSTPKTPSLPLPSITTPSLPTLPLPLPTITVPPLLP